MVINGRDVKQEVYTGGREGYGTGSSVGQKNTIWIRIQRKFIRDKLNEMNNKPYSCPLIRIPEIYLSMAEVMNQLGQSTSRRIWKYCL